jgi:2-polyprenyl-6-methoxyphenol hydroxylase-like FAD-dependent oxidoreductase
MRVVIIGAGLGGVTAALALRRIGLETALFERTPALREVGAGITLWSNALHALQQIGADVPVREVGCLARTSELRGSRGKRMLLRTDVAKVQTRFSVPNLMLMLHRAELLDALAKQLPTNAIQLGREVAEVTSDDHQAHLRLTTGEVVSADLVIAADGLRSISRQFVAPDVPLRNAGYFCWRGVCELRPDELEEGYLGEWWGRGQRCGILSLPRNRVYWWATKNGPMQQGDQRALALQAFSDWARPLPALIERTREVLVGDIADRAPDANWRRGRVMLLGDAAHPTTPNLGQGACMAMEDAVTLSLAIAQSPHDVRAACDATIAARAERTKEIVTMSRRVGDVGQWSNPLACNLRDISFSGMPPSLFQRELVRFARHRCVAPIVAPHASTR